MDHVWIEWINTYIKKMNVLRVLWMNKYIDKENEEINNQT